jgi:ribosome-associated protein
MTNTMTTTATLPRTSYDVALLAAEAADDRKAGDMVLLDISEVSYLADYLLIVSGYSNAQLRAISQSVQDKIEETYNLLPMSAEGESKGSWVLIDYGDVIVHVMAPESREFYNLEAFWSHGQQVALPHYAESETDH